MTRDEAISIARAAAESEGWPWLEPIHARIERAGPLFGRRAWRIMSNSGSRGCNVIIAIDDATGHVMSRRFASR